MVKKYELMPETKEINTSIGLITLHRIRAVKNFGHIKAGDIGGWVESENNLSHSGTAWIYDDAKVYEKAEVYGDAIVGNDARVYGNAIVSSNAIVCGNATVCGNAKVYSNATVGGNTTVCGDAKVYGNAEVYGNAKIFGIAKACGDAKVCGDAVVDGNAKVSSNAKICLPNHVLVIGLIGSRDDFTTFYRGRDNQIMVKCGCFNGTLNKFLDAVTKTHSNNHYAEVYRAAAELAKLQINLD